jgi:hypothetical protein
VDARRDIAEVACLADASGRNLVLRIISIELGHPLSVPEYPQAAAHLHSIVVACRDCSGGLFALVAALEQLEPGALAVGAARELVTRIQPASSQQASIQEPEQSQPLISHHDPVSRPHVWGAIPLRSPLFVGRENLLAQLRRRLLEAGTTAVLPEALHGLGGIGKSQTVVEYIYRYAAEYDLIWWIPASRTAQVTSSFADLAKVLGLAAESAEAAVRLVVGSLRRRRPPCGRWLLVSVNAGRGGESRSRPG